MKYKYKKTILIAVLGLIIVGLFAPISFSGDVNGKFLQTTAYKLQTGAVFAAQGEGLVACSIEDCTFCDLMGLGKKVIDFMLLEVAPFLAVMMIFYAGIKMLISGGDQNKYLEARKILVAAFVGILIVLGAWFVVNTIVVGLVSGGSFESLKDNWWKIQC